MSDSVQPLRRQPTRLPRPWDSPGKDTGVGCHFLLQCMKVKSESEVASVVSDSVRPHRWQPNKLPRPWDSPGKNTGVGSTDPNSLILFFLLLRYRQSRSKRERLRRITPDYTCAPLPNFFGGDSPLW